MGIGGFGLVWSVRGWLGLVLLGLEGRMGRMRIGVAVVLVMGKRGSNLPRASSGVCPFTPRIAGVWMWLGGRCAFGSMRGLARGEEDESGEGSDCGAVDEYDDDEDESESEESDGESSEEGRGDEGSDGEL